MKKLMKKLEDLMVAVTFAEAGEYDEASRLGEAAPSREDLGGTLQGLKKAPLDSPGK